MGKKNKMTRYHYDTRLQDVVERVRKSEAYELWEFDDETVLRIAHALTHYEESALILATWRSQLKEVNQAIEKLAKDARQILGLLDTMVESRNNYFVWLMSHDGVPLKLLDFPYPREELEHLIVACDRDLDVGSSEFPKTGPIQLEGNQRWLVDYLKGLIAPYTTDDHRNEAFAEDIQELLLIIGQDIGIGRIKNLLSQSS